MCNSYSFITFVLGFNNLDMFVSEETWNEKMNNLIQRRELGTRGTSANADKVRNYISHLSKVFVGKSILDVGCGDCAIKKLLPESTEYYGLDAFPVNDKIFGGAIEDEQSKDFFSVETIIAFAVMDGVRDFNKAIENMKSIATKNIIFLTGVNIPPDKYHTLELKLSDFDYRFSDWNKTFAEEIIPNVWLLEYTR